MSKNIIRVKDIDLKENAPSKHASLEGRVEVLEKEMRRLGRIVRKEASNEPTD